MAVSSYTPPPRAKGPLGTIKDLLPKATVVPGSRAGEIFLAWVPTEGRIDAKQVLFFQSHLDLDTDGYKGASDGTHQDNTSLHDTEVLSPAKLDKKGHTLRRAKTQRDNVDSNVVPYFVLPLMPGSDSNWVGKKEGIALGDVGVIIGQNKVLCVEFADAGPSVKLGEASMQVHRFFGHNPLNARGKINDSDIATAGKADFTFVTIVFPGSGLHRRLTVDEITGLARPLFVKLGGLP
jgi:Fungal chitosanase of glycosyl hydrolase group 75